MDLATRIDLLHRLGEYMLSGSEDWKEAKEKASLHNPWFIPEFVELACNAIVKGFLQKQELQDWALQYSIPGKQLRPKIVGIVMAGNIPLVGFHDFLAAFISGHRQLDKLSSKDEILLKHLVGKLVEWNGAVADYVSFSELLKNCDAYIATGSNNSARYFQYYFSRYANLIRKNRTSVAVLTGMETHEQLEKLADDVYLYFGLGCRNVTKLYAPVSYDFGPLLNIFKKYDYLAEFHKYKNNYDYRLALLILNRQFYMTNGSILLTENVSPFSAISELHYEFYEKEVDVSSGELTNQIQCLVGTGLIPFGQAQQPDLCDYADGSDTLQFLLDL